MCEPQRAIFLVHKPGHKWKELHERYSQWYFLSPLPTVFFLVVGPWCLSRDNCLSLSLSPLSNFNSKKKGRKKGPKRATKLPASVIEFFFISLYCFLFLFQQQVWRIRLKRQKNEKKKSERKRPLDSTEKVAKAICVFIVSFCFLRYLYFLSPSDFLFSFFTLFPFFFLLVRLRMKKKTKTGASRTAVRIAVSR